MSFSIAMNIFTKGYSNLSKYIERKVVLDNYQMSLELFLGKNDKWDY